MRYILILSYFFMTLLQAKSIYIVDQNGHQTLVKNPVIYYTSKKGSALNLFYQPDVEKRGIRIKQGMGMVVIPWEQIETLYMDHRTEGSISATLEQNHTVTPLELIPPADVLEGASELGTFLIHFKDIMQVKTVRATDQQLDSVPKKFHIQWGEGLNLKLTKDGFTTTIDGLKVFGSFNIKDEDFRSVDRAKKLRFPLHPMLLVEYDHTIYILDSHKEEMIGQFKIPSLGSPRFVKIEPYENGYTSLKVMFRILPVPTEEENEIKYVGRPGPLITTIMVYEDGEYIYLKKKGE